MKALKEKLEYLKQTDRIVNYKIIDENTYSIQPVKAADKITIIDTYKEKENKNDDKHKL